MKQQLLFLLISSQVFCQTVNFTGKLLDKETNEPAISLKLTN
jgi:hypothetical protein